ncbi:hypothetical protein SAMN05428949_5659 [Chitinophaga sp. YR627]|uniref:YggS family pyridoxal phosphate-dependent enzyme n=1 Tax=Chitinophaga sp. YR627 TaxID=1881041 RepID=UPI0008E3D648|nr:YggS family pyridoxal phosphate-dependent enzyme [Chitinophaga sp. YR627]SFO54141.1 hypothetical protein SAMN05428949_5659 [Chitinophaga sp. YR627]
MKEIIIHNLHTVHKRIALACEQSGRNSADIRLLLATKTVPAAYIRMAIEAGENLIGENKVQEFRDKHDALADLSVERHFIGHLQHNKVKDVLKYVSCVQSLDRLSIAGELDRRLQQEGRSLDVFIQVNTSYEDSKFGLQPAEVAGFIRQLKSLDTLQIKGLMTIGLLDVDKEKMRPSLTLLRQTREQLIATGIENSDQFKLSMGMSQDLEMAIAEGADIIRVGTAVFGNRVVGKEIWNESEAEK